MLEEAVLRTVYTGAKVQVPTYKNQDPVASKEV